MFINGSTLHGWAVQIYFWHFSSNKTLWSSQTSLVGFAKHPLPQRLLSWLTLLMVDLNNRPQVPADNVCVTMAGSLGLSSSNFPNLILVSFSNFTVPLRRAALQVTIFRKFFLDLGANRKILHWWLYWYTCPNNIEHAMKKRRLVCMVFWRAYAELTRQIYNQERTVRWIQVPFRVA